MPEKAPDPLERPCPRDNAAICTLFGEQARNVYIVKMIGLGLAGAYRIVWSN